MCKDDLKIKDDLPIFWEKIKNKAPVITRPDQLNAIGRLAAKLTAINYSSISLHNEWQEVNE